MAKVNLGLIGVGTVGSGVVRLLDRNAELIRARTGIELALVHVADRGIHEIRDLRLHGRRCSTRAEAVIEDPEVDVVVELIGGLEPARSYIAAALERGKHVVTANKALLAHHGPELFGLADRSGAGVGFEGSVAGTIPILRALREGLAADRIGAVAGIVNGTTNYVLTRMLDDALSYPAALAEAQENGFAEADPSLDVGGADAAHKLAILASLAFGVRASQDEIHVEGIREIAPEDVAFARRHGCAIKLLAIGRHDGEEVELRVHPALVPASHPLASVRLEQNAVVVSGEASGDTMYHGRGAGSLPTATAVLGDAIEMAGRCLEACRRPGCREGRAIRTRDLVFSTARLRPRERFRSRFYLRFPIVDRPGAIGALTTSLGAEGVSIAHLEARVVDGVRGRGCLEILTHEAMEASVDRAIAAFRATGALDGPERRMRLFP